MVRAVSVATVLALALLSADPARAAEGGEKHNEGPVKPHSHGSNRVDCQMGDWTPYESCGASGYKSRTRMVVVPPSKGGSPCPATMEMAKCSKFEFWMGPWSDWVCNVKTGMKARTRKVVNVGKASYKSPPLKEKAVCDPIPCVINTEDEDTRPWGECKLNKKKQWVKTKVLGIKAPAQYGGLCPAFSDPMRKATAPCPPVNCAVNSVDEEPSAWSECTLAGDGSWYQIKQLGIKTQPLYGGTACPEAGSDARIEKKLCTPVDCVLHTLETDTGAWDSDCQQKTGTNLWYEHKQLGVATPAKWGGAACADVGTVARTAEKLCTPVDCEAHTVETEPGVWDGDCQQKAGTNSWFEHKPLTIKTPAKWGGIACAAEGTAARTAEKLCTPVNCEAHTVDTEPSGWDGVCLEKGSTNKFYEHMSLGIATPAKWGGIACADEGSEARTLEKLCTPVDCVLQTAESEPNAWNGECVEKGSTNTFYEHKTLTVMTPAKWGGAECSADRTAEKLCTPVDCEAYTVDTEPGAWDGECVEKGSTDTWFEHKPLTAKTPAKWGGIACAAEGSTARTAEKLCTPVDCEAHTVDTEPGAWDNNCVEKGSTNTWFEHKPLTVKTPAKWGGIACAAEGSTARTAEKLCTPVDCVPNPDEEATGVWDNTCVQKGTSGKWYEHKILGVKTPARNGGVECAESSIVAERLCTPVDCELHTAETEPIPWDDNCVEKGITNVYYEHKTLTVKTPAKWGGTECSADRTAEKLCTPVDCALHTAESEPNAWDDSCQRKAGTDSWFEHKTLTVATPAKWGGASCPGEGSTARTAEKLCTPVDCVAHTVDTEPSGWDGSCVEKGSTNTWFEHKALSVLTPAQWGGAECADVGTTARTAEKLCTPVACVAHTVETEPTGWDGTCVEKGTTNTWYEHKPLTIKTPAKWGGAECAAEGSTARIAEKLCTPVDCVLHTPESEPSDWDETCVLKAGTTSWFEHKILTVATPAKWGGTDCAPVGSTARIAEQLCPPVDCVEYTLANDPGAFGACTEGSETTGLYKIKVLGIQSLPKYGGAACSTVEARTVTEACTIMEYFSALTKPITAPNGNTQLRNAKSVYTARQAGPGGFSFGTLTPPTSAAPSTLIFSGGDPCPVAGKTYKLSVTVLCGKTIDLAAAVQVVGNVCEWTTTLRMPVYGICPPPNAAP